MWCCAVRGCGAVGKRSKQGGRLAYTFPTKDLLVRQAWLQFVGKDEIESMSCESRICADHFAEEDYERWGFGGKKKLKDDAVPRFRTKEEKDQYARDSKEKHFSAAEYLKNVYARIGLQAEPLSTVKKQVDSEMNGRQENLTSTYNKLVAFEELNSEDGLKLGSRSTKPNQKPRDDAQRRRNCLICGTSQAAEKRNGSRTRKWISTANTFLPALESPVDVFLTERHIVDPSIMAALRDEASMCSTCWSLMVACDRSYGRFRADVEKLRTRQCSTYDGDETSEAKNFPSMNTVEERSSQSVDSWMQSQDVRTENSNDPEENVHENPEIDFSSVLEPAVYFEVLSETETPYHDGEASIGHMQHSESQQIGDGGRFESYGSPGPPSKKAKTEITEGLPDGCNGQPTRRKHLAPVKATFSNLDLVGLSPVSLFDMGIQMSGT